MKPRIFYWLGSWWCSEGMSESFCWQVTPSQHPNGSPTPKEAYLRWYKDTHKVTIWNKIKTWFKGYFV